MHIPRSLAAALALLALASLTFAQSDPPAPTPQPATPAPAPKKDPPPASTPTTPAATPAKKPDAPRSAFPSPSKPAAEPTLKVGHRAPALQAETWVKNGAAADAPAITAFEPGKVYVLEFWATWCPSCKEAMPGLAKLARDHQELTIIAIASSERKPKPGAPDERLDGVRKFVKDRDDAMPYAVLFDGARSMASAYLVPAGRTLIPTAFILDHTGAIAWIGDARERAFESAVVAALKAAAPPKPAPTPETSKKPAKTSSRN